MEREDNFNAGILVSNHPRFEVGSKEPDSVVLDRTHGARGELLRVRELGRLSKDAYYRPPTTFLGVLLDLCRYIFSRSK